MRRSPRALSLMALLVGAVATASCAQEVARDPLVTKTPAGLAVQDGRLIWVSSVSEADPLRVLVAATALARLGRLTPETALRADSAAADALEPGVPERVAALVQVAEYGRAAGSGSSAPIIAQLRDVPVAQVPADLIVRRDILLSSASSGDGAGKPGVACADLLTLLPGRLADATVRASTLHAGECAGVLPVDVWERALGSGSMDAGRAAQLRYLPHLSAVLDLGFDAPARAALEALQALDAAGDGLPVHAPLQYLDDVSRLAGESASGLSGIAAGLQQTVTVGGADADILGTDAVGTYYLYSYLDRFSPSSRWATWAARDEQAWLYLQGPAPANATAMESQLAALRQSDSGPDCASLDLPALRDGLVEQASDAAPTPFRLTMAALTARILSRCGVDPVAEPAFDRWEAELLRLAAAADGDTAPLLRWAVAESSCLRTDTAAPEAVASPVDAELAIGDIGDIGARYASERLEELRVRCTDGWWALN